MQKSGPRRCLVVLAWTFGLTLWGSALWVIEEWAARLKSPMQAKRGLAWGTGCDFFAAKSRLSLWKFTFGP